MQEPPYAEYNTMTFSVPAFPRNPFNNLVWCSIIQLFNKRVPPSDNIVKQRGKVTNKN